MIKGLKVVLPCAVLLLAACAGKQDNPYLAAKNGRLLVVKSPLTKRHLDTGFVLSDPRAQKTPDNLPPSLKS